jgi:hypothetical protein
MDLFLEYTVFPAFLAPRKDSTAFVMLFHSAAAGNIQTPSSADSEIPPSASGNPSSTDQSSSLLKVWSSISGSNT